MFGVSKECSIVNYDDSEEDDEEKFKKSKNPAERKITKGSISNFDKSLTIGPKPGFLHQNWIN